MQIKMVKEDNKIYFEFQHLDSIEEVHKEIIKDEGHCCQMVAFSTFHDALTQINFTERKIRSNIRRGD